MNNWLKNNIVSSLSLVTLLGLAYMAAKYEQRLFTEPEVKYETEKHVKSVDPVKLYGEYIADSIEEVHTQDWRKKQMHKDSVQDSVLKQMEQFIRLNVKLTDDVKKILEHDNQ
jgi:hypothetical protein